METIEQLQKEIKRLENKSWYRCGVEHTKKEWIKLNSQLEILKEVVEIINELLPKYCEDGADEFAEQLKHKLTALTGSADDVDSKKTKLKRAKK